MIPPRALAAALLLSPVAVWAHAFPDHSDPRVGHTLSSAPSRVRVWFDSELEPVFSTIRVESSEGQQVDRGDARLDPGDTRLLEVDLTPLPSGTYRVFWSVVARDGHRTEGDFRFRVK